MGGAGQSATSRVPAWDPEKVRRVLEGTAVVRVVDVEPPSPSSAPVGKQVGKVMAAAPKEATTTEATKEAQAHQPACCAKLCASARETGLGVLEESMRALTLGKK